MDLSNFVLHDVRPTIMYIPNFITFAEEQQIIAKIDNAPKPKWTQLLKRRLINYGGIPHPKGMIAEEIPVWLSIFIEKINNLGIFGSWKANHVLVNEYLPGQGIMPHSDGPLFSNIITTISCGSHTILEFHRSKDDEKILEDDLILKSSNEGCEFKRNLYRKLLIEPRSLLIVKDEMYTDYLHSISEVNEDLLSELVCNLPNCGDTYNVGNRIPRSKRISLTIRNVPNTTKFQLKHSV